MFTVDIVFDSFNEPPNLLCLPVHKSFNLDAVYIALCHIG